MKKKLNELLIELCENPIEIDLSQENIMQSARDATVGEDSNRRAKVVLREFNDLGFDNRTQKIPLTSYSEFNVIGILKGKTKEELVVCAHHDRIPGTPGADDNASGMVSLIGLAHELADRYENPEKTVRLISFGAEENVQYIKKRRGMVGSKRYVRYYDTENVWGVVNLDLIGRERPLNVVERDSIGTAIYDIDLAGIVRGVGYGLGIKVESCYTSTSTSDNRPFAEKGIKSVWLTRLNPRRNRWKIYHSKEDKPETIKLKYIEENKNLLLNIVDYFMEKEDD